MNNSSHFTMNVQGINVYYERYYNPSKPPLVLVHGFLSSTFCYRKLIPLLKDEFEIIAIDLPPFGKSEKSTSFVYSYRNMANLVIKMVDRLHIKNAYLAGHSMGGQISLYAIKARPDLFKKVILLCSSGYMKRAHSSLVFSSYIPYFYLFIKHWLARQGGVLRNLSNVVHDRTLIDQEMMDGYVQPFYDDKIFLALTRMIRDREGDLSPEDLNSIEVPSLIIWGEEDKVIPVHIGEKLHKDLRNSSFVSFKKTGHLIPEERPEYVSEKMFDFCHI
ncbi:alpha/beta fold hydrolase [Metabacillus arenae]|uniref:Alpha/beta hydrolase n=1 Tax=Metabacillus arenae TaxID=2771434 RepID=A0A926NKS9_9BACI|nr:alpha/beta hydrolase [Metabacillus arenae]MBD1382575.1 alpha/beta hydrolase [Metabacillus arenae]